MGWIWKIGVGLLLWMGALFGVLQIGLAATLDGHGHTGLSICGPWGCGPPVLALIGWHGFWVVVVAPPVLALIYYVGDRPLWRMGIAASGAGLLALIAIAVYQAVTWLPLVGEGAATYFVRRCLFVAVTLTDVPIIPVTLAGLGLLAGAVVKRRWRRVAAGGTQPSARLPDSEPAASPFREPVGEPVGEPDV